MRYYRMADLNVLIYGEEHFPYVSERLSAYTAAEFSDPDVVIRLEDVEFIPLPQREPSAKSWSLTWYYRDSDSYDIYIVEKEDNGACSQIHSNKTWSEITVRTSSSHITGVDIGVYASQMVWRVMTNAIIYRGGLILHSSAISYKNQGILFSAPSGTGKSTHTQLWKKLYPNDVDMVNDDTPAIRSIDGIHYVYGLPWSGKGENKNRSVPLKAIVFLQRSEQNVISLSDIDDSVFYLLEQSRPAYFDGWEDVRLNTLEELIRSVKIYSLGANMEDDAALTVKNAVFGEDG